MQSLKGRKKILQMFCNMEDKMNNVQKEDVIEIKELVKKYKMYNRKKDRLLEAIIPSFSRHTDFMAIDELNLTIKKGEILRLLDKIGAEISPLLQMRL